MDGDGSSKNATENVSEKKGDHRDHDHGEVFFC